MHGVYVVLCFLLGSLHMTAALAFSLDGNNLGAVAQMAGGVIWMGIAAWRLNKD
jgi:hypothetical protein